MKNVFIIICLLLSATGVQAADGEHTSKTVTTTKLTKSIYLLQGKGGNVGVSVGEDGVLMIDDDYSEMADGISDAINALSSSDIKFLINTHWHGDHTGNNAEFGEEAVIVAHDNVRKRLSTKQVVELFNMVSEPKPKQALPVITFDEAVTLHFNGEEVDVIHYPNSHTDGDGVIFFRGSNVVHLGDMFFNGFYPFVDLGSGGNVESLKNNIALLVERIPSDAKIIPGHGRLADLKDLKSYHKMLVDVSDIVQGYIKDGKTLEEAKKASLPKSIVSKWGGGFLSTDVWLEIVYKSYSQ